MQMKGFSILSTVFVDKSVDKFDDKVTNHGSLSDRPKLPKN